MKSFSFPVVVLHWSLLCLAVICCARASYATEDESLHAEAILVWGTNDPQSPDPKHIPVDNYLLKKLTNSPYKWKYYFEVPPRQPLDIAVGETKKGIHISQPCSLDVKNLGKNRVEVHLYGKGKPVLVNTEPFDDRYLIYAGPSANETAWFVVIRKIKPHVPKVVPVSSNSPAKH